MASLQSNKKYSPTKLNPYAVFAIRALLAYGNKGKEIAKIFNLHPSTVSRIKLGKYWKNI